MQIKISRHYHTTLFILLALHPIVATQPDTPQALTYAITKHYLGSYEIKKNTKKSDTTWLSYDNTKRPDLSISDQENILLKRVYAHSQALKDFLQAKKNNRVIFPSSIWENINLFKRKAPFLTPCVLDCYLGKNRTPLQTIAMTIRLSVLTHSIQQLRREQQITNILVKDRELTDSLAVAYYELSAVLKSLLALYHKDLDPVWSERFQNLFKRDGYEAIRGKFKSISQIEKNKKLRLYLGYPLLFLIGLVFVIGGIFCLSVIGDDDIFVISIIAISIGLVLMYLPYPLYQQEYVFNSYISDRLADIQNLFEIAERIVIMIEDNPKLKSLCSSEFTHTIKLLTRTHENQTYNELVDLFLLHDFKHWSLWFDSRGILLTTFTKVQKNVDMLNSLLVELGQISTYVCAAQRIQNAYGSQAYSFTQPELLPQNTACIQLQGMSTPNMPNIALDDILINSSSCNTFAISGDFRPKETIIQSIINTTIGAMAGLPVPVQNAKITPLHAIHVTKGSQQDLNKQKYRLENNTKTITFYQGPRNTTNHTDQKELHSIAMTMYGIEECTNNINIISTDNPYLIELIKDYDKAKSYYIISEYIGNRYQFNVVSNENESQNETFANINMKQQKIAERTKEIEKKIKKLA